MYGYFVILKTNNNEDLDIWCVILSANKYYGREDDHL